LTVLSSRAGSETCSTTKIANVSVSVRVFEPLEHAQVRPVAAVADRAGLPVVAQEFHRAEVFAVVGDDLKLRHPFPSSLGWGRTARRAYTVAAKSGRRPHPRPVVLCSAWVLALAMTAGGKTG
jgi:hypothetical protein